MALPARELVAAAATRPEFWTLLGILLAILHRLFQLYEVVSFLPWLAAHCPKCCCCCCCRRGAFSSLRKPRGQQNWERLIGTESFYELEKKNRHAKAIREQWSGWARLSNALRNPTAGAPQTWAQWSQWGARLRNHAWRAVKNFKF